MARSNTDRRLETAQMAGDGAPGRDFAARDLVVIDGGSESRAATGCGPAAARPRAEFLAQLLVSFDPAMRQSRGERTRFASARYAEAAMLRARA